MKEKKEYRSTEKLVISLKDVFDSALDTFMLSLVSMVVCGCVLSSVTSLFKGTQVKCAKR